MHPFLVLSAMALAAASGPAVGQTAAATASAECRVKSRSDAVVVMVCPPAASDARWQADAANACREKKFCNVWIWNDADKAPTKAPASDAEMPKEAAKRAVAIWANDSNSLMKVRPAAGAGK
jgi:hypothetical protein